MPVCFNDPPRPIGGNAPPAEQTPRSLSKPIQRITGSPLSNHPKVINGDYHLIAVLLTPVTEVSASAARRSQVVFVIWRI